MYESPPEEAQHNVSSQSALHEICIHGTNAFRSH